MTLGEKDFRKEILCEKEIKNTDDCFFYSLPHRRLMTLRKRAFENIVGFTLYHIIPTFNDPEKESF